MHGCSEFRRNLSRRQFVKAGALGMTGLGLADILRLQAASAGSSQFKDKSVIILWQRGGPSQHETWDPKPHAPQEYRGAFGSCLVYTSPSPRDALQSRMRCAA